MSIPAMLERLRKRFGTDRPSIYQAMQVGIEEGRNQAAQVVINYTQDMDIQAMRLGDRLAESIRKLNELDQLRAGDK